MNEQLIKHWLSLLPDPIRDTLIEMDNSEHWTAREGELLFEAASELSRALQQIYGSTILLKEEQEFTMFIESLAYLKTSQAMHLLSLMAKKQPGLGGDLIIASHNHYHESIECHLMIARIHVLFRLQVIDRIFGEDRRQLVLDILRKISRENTRYPL